MADLGAPSFRARLAVWRSNRPVSADTCFAADSGFRIEKFHMIQPMPNKETHTLMNPRAIISRGQALQILRMDLRRAALEKRAAELRTVSEQEREGILAQIDREIEAELRRRAKQFGHSNVIY